MTLSSTLAGFVFGTLLGILLAVGIVHVKSLQKSLMPWIISSQTIPILALAPILVVVAFNLLTGQLKFPTDFSRFVAKALISTYLSFFPVTVGMVKGLRSPDPFHLDLMRTYSATRAQVLWKLRLPASLPFLFTSMKVGIAASLVGAIVAELPTGAVAGIGAKLLVGSYYSQSVQMWSALVVGSLLAALLVTAVGIVERITNRIMGVARPMSPPAVGVGNWRGWAAFIALVAALAFPIVVTGGTQTYLVGLGSDAILATVIMVAAAFASLTRIVFRRRQFRHLRRDRHRGDLRHRLPAVGGGPRRRRTICQERSFRRRDRVSGRWSSPHGPWRRSWSAASPKSAPRGAAGPC